MKKIIFGVFILLLLPFSIWAQGIIIDHHCTDLSNIPTSWVTAVKNNMRVHYAHTSHGSQITRGLRDALEVSNPDLSVAIQENALPTETGALCIFDGNGYPGDTYIGPDYYWETADGRTHTQGVLDNYSTINVSMWCWCTQLEYYNASQVNDYLARMTAFENANQDVTFVYFTGNAQNLWCGEEEGYNRYLRNEQIRQYCSNNNKILFDFADLDAWYNGSKNSYSYGGHQVPLLNDAYGGDGDGWGHVNKTCAENKAKAYWWMLARIAGWDGTGPTPTPTPTPTPSTIPGDWVQQIDGSIVTQQWGWAMAVPVPGDFDGDGIDDLTVYYQPTGDWYIKQSSDGTTRNTQWGWADAVAVPGDFDGDGTDDIAVYYQPTGDWYIRQSSDQEVVHRQWGWDQARAVPADYDGDSIADMAVYYQPTGDWYIFSSLQNGLIHRQWGWSAAEAVPADYDGDGIDDIAVYYAPSGDWYILQSTDSNVWHQQWGWSTASPVPGDFDGDGRDDIAVGSPTDGTWYIKTGSGNMTIPIPTGATALPVVGDFDGNGSADPGWYVTAP